MRKIPGKIQGSSYSSSGEAATHLPLYVNQQFAQEATILSLVHP